MAGTPALVRLPWPPGTNNLYVTVNRRRIRSPRYRAWQTEAGWRLQAAKLPKFTGPVSITLELCSPHNRRTDADGKIKPVVDLLVTHGVIPDDSSKYVKSVKAEWVQSVHSCTVTIEEAT